MTIEQKAISVYGLTDEPELATWLLASGDMLNGTYCGLRRDVDHHEISQFFKRSVYQDPGSAYIYVKKFLRRGNIRVVCSESHYGLEYAVTPTPAQIQTIRRIHLLAERNAIPFLIERFPTRSGVRVKTFDYTEFIIYMASCPKSGV